MDGILLIARLVLAAVFLVAAIGKLADLPGSRRAITGFGVPETLAEPIGLALPIAELAVAVALIPNPWAPWGALGALVLLGAFIAGISLSLARGQTPDCHCFGQFYSEPIGRSTLLRNGVLALLAAFIVIAGRSNPGRDPLAWTLSVTNSERAGLVLGVLALILLATQCWFLMQISRQNSALLRRAAAPRSAGLLPLPGGAQIGSTESAPMVEEGPPAGLPVGSPAPSFAVPDLDGRLTTLDDLLAAGKPVMLVFTSPDCGPCAALMPEVAEWQRQYADYLEIAVLGEGTVDVNQPKSDEAGLETMFLQTGREVAEMYEASATPGAVIVYPGRIVASPLALGADAIRGLCDQLLGLFNLAPLVQLQDQAPPRLPVAAESGATPATTTLGAPLPHVHLTEFTGETVELADLVDGETLFVFWRSTCGFCEQMLPTLQAWEASPPRGAPKLVVILTATPDSKQIVSFSSTTVIDTDGEAARALGAQGTPMAVLVDAEARIASAVAAGAAEVMELAAGTNARATA